MYDESGHPLLAQIPLTVSPFISLPTAITLPYTYKNLPAALPPSSTPDRSGSINPEIPKFVVSSSGQAVHPHDIMESCQKLEKHIQRVSEDADKNIAQWRDSIKDRELADKRRVAPGWLDRDEKILQPENTSSSQQQQQKPPNLMDDGTNANSEVAAPASDTGGAELDRAFGTVGSS